MARRLLSQSRLMRYLWRMMLGFEVEKAPEPNKILEYSYVIVSSH